MNPDIMLSCPDPPNSHSLIKNTIMAKRISIINFKGGVGKTTLAFNLGTGLACFHSARVLLIDMDHQSSLSIVCLGPDKWNKAIDESHTVDKIFQPFVDPSAPPSDEIIIKAPKSHISIPDYAERNYDIHIIPASLNLDNTEIELTASHQGDAIHSEWSKRTLICSWIEDNNIDDNYDYIIFDCPPATKIVSQNAIAASHGYIIPVVPEAVMERGAPHLRDMMKSGIDARLKRLAKMGEPRSVHVPDTKLLGLVITRIRSASSHSGYTDEHTQHLESLKKRWEKKLIRPYIYDGTGVTAALSAGHPVFDTKTDNWKQNIRQRGIDDQYKKVTKVIKSRIDAL